MNGLIAWLLVRWIDGYPAVFWAVAAVMWVIEVLSIRQLYFGTPGTQAALRRTITRLSTAAAILVGVGCLVFIAYLLAVND